MKRKKSLQRVLSAFLTILLLVSVVPTAVFAGGNGNLSEDLGCSRV